MHINPIGPLERMRTSVLLMCGLLFVLFNVALISYLSSFWEAVWLGLKTLYNVLMFFRNFKAPWSFAAETRQDATEDDFTRASDKFNNANAHLRDAQLQIRRYAQDVQDLVRAGTYLELTNPVDVKKWDDIQRGVRELVTMYHSVARSMERGSNGAAIAATRLGFVVRAPGVSERDYLLSVRRGALRFKDTLERWRDILEETTLLIDSTLDTSTSFCADTMNAVQEYQRLDAEAKQGATLIDYVRGVGFSGMACLLPAKVLAGLAGASVVLTGFAPIVAPIVASGVMIAGMTTGTGYYLHTLEKDKLEVQSRAQSMTFRLNRTAHTVGTIKVYLEGPRRTISQVSDRVDNLIGDLKFVESAMPSDPTIVKRFLNGLEWDFDAAAKVYATVMTPHSTTIPSLTDSTGTNKFNT